MTIEQLEETANEIRQDVVTMLVKAGSGHSAGPLGMADVFAALYLAVAHLKPKDPDWPDRDRIVLSNGHICPVLYATMAHAGYFPRSELKTLRQFGSRLQGHPHRTDLPGLETTSGPLGSGLSQAVGMALAARMDGATWRVYCLMSDGEHNEGNTWEAILLAAKENLTNLTVVMDRNYIQIDGYTEHILPLEPLAEKYQAFGWHVVEIDGHNMEAIIDAFNTARGIADRPTLILARTIPGKGVEFMEGDYLWHGKPPTSQEARRALKQLRTLKGKITSESE